MSTAAAGEYPTVSAKFADFIHESPDGLAKRGSLNALLSLYVLSPDGAGEETFLSRMCPRQVVGLRDAIIRRKEFYSCYNLLESDDGFRSVFERKIRENRGHVCAESTCVWILFAKKTFLPRSQIGEQKKSSAPFSDARRVHFRDDERKVEERRDDAQIEFSPLPFLKIRIDKKISFTPNPGGLLAVAVVAVIFSAVLKRL